MDNLTVRTTNGELFTGDQSCELAYLIYLRFGSDDEAAHIAWKRLLQNNCPFVSYMRMVELHKNKLMLNTILTEDVSHSSDG